MLMSEPDTATDLVVVLLPADPVPPLISLIAPVVAVTVTAPAAVGVPLTAHEMLAPAATLAGGTGLQVPTETPAGSPEITQVALVAEAVAVALLVHLTVPEYATPTCAVAGRPETSGVMSEPVTATVVVAALFERLPSLPALVVPETVEDATVVGVPETVQVIFAPAATEVGGTGAHVVVKPAGSPLTAQVADDAAWVAAAAFVHVKVPL